MPNYSSTSQYAAYIRSIGKKIEGSQREAVNQAALILKKSILQQANIATGGSLMLRNVGSVSNRSGRFVPVRNDAGRTLRVGYDIVGEVHPTALLLARGPWGIVEYTTSPHDITPRLGTIQRKGKAALKYKRELRQRQLDVAFGGAGVFAGVPPLNVQGMGEPRYRVKHPGTKGKFPWKRGIELVRDIAARRAKSVISFGVVDHVRTNGRTLTYLRGEHSPNAPFKVISRRYD